MIKVARMLSIKIPIAIMSQDQVDKAIEVVILEPLRPAPTMVLGSRILRERLTGVNPRA